MSETALPNNENNHPKPQKARGGVGKILSFPDKVGSHVFHNVIGIGKFGKLEEILGNPSGEVIKNVKNRFWGSLKLASPCQQINRQNIGKHRQAM